MVTIIERFRQLVAGAPAPAPAPAKIAVSGGEEKRHFGKTSRDLATLKKYLDIYNRGGPVSEAVDIYALTALSNGYRLEGSPADIEYTQGILDSFDFETILYDGVIRSLVIGDSFQEIQRNKAGGVYTVHLRSSERFKIETDPSLGGVLRYLFLEDANADKWVPLEPEDIVHLALYPDPPSPYGRSLIGRAIDDIMRDATTADGTAAAIRRHGYPKYHISVGQSGEDVPESVIDEIELEFRNLTSRNDFATGPDIEIRTIDAGGLPGAEAYVTISMQRLAASLGVPEEMLGLGRGSTEATANVRLRVFYDKVAAIQRRVGRAYSLQLIDQITGRPGAVRLVFNDPNPFDEAATAEWIAKIMTATPLDPFSVLPQDWIRKKFGIELNDQAEEEPDDDDGTEEEV